MSINPVSAQSLIRFSQCAFALVAIIAIQKWCRRSFDAQLHVQDSKGIAVPNAKIELFSTASSFPIYTVSSDAKGDVILPAVSFVKCSIVVEAQGFEKQKINWSKEDNSPLVLQKSKRARIKFEFLEERDESKGVSFMIATSQGDVFSERKSLLKDESEWIIPRILPGRYMLYIDGIGYDPRQFQFDATESDRFGQPLDFTDDEVEEFDVTFRIVPFKK